MPAKQLFTFSLVSLAFLFALACTQKKNTLFTQLPSGQSGIHFSNDIHENDSTNSFINEFGYMGGGVGIGDFNNDGLKDIFFTGNQVSSKLYINKGENKFEDVTEKAGVHTEDWATGISIADVNADGYDDIYVCVFGKNLLQRAKNLLFINQHNLTFKEQAAAYGLADTGYSTQAAFFDYDRDGDLDMYLANYLLSDRNANTINPRDRSGHSPANDKLFRNDGPLVPGTDGKRTGGFTDVTLEAGIKEDGYGLGVSVSDLNEDGWPDLYVTNDFITNDELWLNNRNGTFTNVIADALQHQSYSSMGVDAADLNNDGLADVVTLDMLPEYNERKKTSFFFMNYERYQAERRMGYEPEFMRNMLQLNNGSYKQGDTSIPFFSEIGQLSGISSTDWSWSVLLADFDNDGWKDMHITNGIGRDFINSDFLEFSNQTFGNGKSRAEQEKAIQQKLADLKHVNLKNYLYLNHHDYTFADASDSSGVNEPGMSNGAAYADLDNDGDLDLVVNNINSEAFVFLNNTVQKNKPITSHFLRVSLQGDSLNRQGFGAKIEVYIPGSKQVQEQAPVRGFFSSVDQQLLFGLGKEKQVDSIVIIWPGDNKQVVKNITADTLLTVSKNSYGFIPPLLGEAGWGPGEDLEKGLFTPYIGISYLHHDNNYNDFGVQRLLPQKFSQLGPFITTGDVNGDGKTDFFVGGAFNFSGQVFTQNSSGAFGSKKLTEDIKMEEDEDCLLLDADTDGDLDLFVTSGDVQFADTSHYNQPRLYLNDGKGNFTLNPAAIPAGVRTIAGCVSAADYDADGDLDIFIGGRVSGNYPLAARSFILQNNKGIFTDVTASVCPALQRPGMVTSAIWTDFDGDKQPDLVVAGEWMPIRFFKNNKGHLQETTDATGLQTMNGMWRSLAATDLDGDGDVDLVAGNLGLNCQYKVSEKEPMQLFATDLDGNGTIDPVFFYYIKDNDGTRRPYPAVSRMQLADQVPAIKKQFLLYADYAKATYDDIFKNKPKEKIQSLNCDETRSCWLENVGGGKWVKHLLPMEAQFAPVNAIVCDDVDGDGVTDLLLAGNEYSEEVMTGRYDASYGCFLKGNKSKTFTSIPAVQSGFRVKGDVKDMALIHTASGEKLLLVAINNDAMKAFKMKTGDKNK